MKLSIIIPTINEEENIGALIDYLRENVGGNVPLQIIIADAGSTDQTQNIARYCGTEVLESSQKRRSVQMNLAAALATGEIIYFVHADTRPPANFGDYIINAVQSGSDAGCFTSIFDWKHPFLRFCNAFSRLPFWFCRGGGQTLFVSKKLFKKLHGFDEKMLLMEEYDFITRVRKHSKFKIIRKNAVTSARDYRVNGAFRLQFIYSYVFFLYALGASQEKILRVVRRHVKKA